MVARNESGRVAVSHDDPCWRAVPYGCRVVTQRLEDKLCIQMKRPFRPWGDFTVAEYDECFRSSSLTGSAAQRSEFACRWVPDAPPVETLMPDGWEGEDLSYVRVTNPEAYDAQMRKLLGIA